MASGAIPIMQGQLMAAFNTLELGADEVERSSLIVGLNDLRAGKTRSLVDIRQS